MNSTQLPEYTKHPSEINQIFDVIAPKYDFLNKFLSFKRDDGWRRKAVRQSVEPWMNSVLDIGTGSGVFLYDITRFHPFEKAVGADFSKEMLKQAEQRLGNKAKLDVVELPKLPYEDDQFDLISSAFVLRSIADLDSLFQESYRVLSSKGKFVILELTRPTSWWMKALYFPYLNIYLPFVGRFFSGSWNAYKFLSSSIQKFYGVSELEQKIKDAGFKKVNTKSFTFGICTMIIAEKTV